jgi:hypothetical protein
MSCSRSILSSSHLIWSHHYYLLEPVERMRTILKENNIKSGEKERERDLWSRAWVSVDSSEVMEADVDKNIVAIEDVESEDERVLDLPEVGDDVRVERPHNSSDPNQNQTETE